MADDENLSRPARFLPVLERRDGADPELVALGERYWAWRGVRGDAEDALGGQVNVWAETTRELSDAFGEPSTRLYIYAAAGVEVTLSDFECGTCSAPVALKSRTSLDALMRGASPATVCSRCDARLTADVRRLADPAHANARAGRRRIAAERRAAQEAQAEQRRKAAVAACELDARRREAIRFAHPMELSDLKAPDWDQFRSRFRVEVGLLALLDYAPSTTPIPPLESWDQVLCPNLDMRDDLIMTSYRSGLLRVHPDATATNAFVWADEEPEQLTDQFYPTRVHWYAWQGPSMGTAAEATQRRLRQRATEWLNTEQGVLDACDLAVELIAAETVRYLLEQLKAHNLPEVPENHASRLWESAKRLSEVRSLGECYSVAWRAARNAASLAQQRPYAPAANMTTYAVNWFESTASSVVADTSLTLPVYREDNRTPLSGFTRTLFLQVLNNDPMATSALVA